MTRVFSGIQPSGELHLGNYVGAIRAWVRDQQEKESFICVVDLHAITVYQDPAVLAKNVRQLAALLFASGLDPNHATVFVQSHVRAHAECQWMLTCATPVGWLERMTQYKTKARRQEAVLTGLLTYPVLQAADILLYSADEVPVGEDQKQHIELSRDIAQRFNSLYGETFKVPKPMIPKVGARIMALDDPTSKMSKSDSGNVGHAILLTDSEAKIRKAISRAVTDSGNEVVFSDDPERAGVNNLLTIYQALTEKPRAEVEADFADVRGYGDLKKGVADTVVERLAPVRTRYEQLMQDPAELDRLLEIGAEKARAVAEPKLEQVKQRVGLSPTDS